MSLRAGDDPTSPERRGLRVQVIADESPLQDLDEYYIGVNIDAGAIARPPMGGDWPG